MTRWDLAERGHRGLTRRQFIDRAAALGLAVSIPAVPWATQSLAATPRKGGHLKVGADPASTTDVLDPAIATARYMEIVGFLWGNCLVEIDENNRPIPELAESWEPNEDATQWIFHLRKGVTFHNGKEFTAEDVVFTIQHHLGDESRSGAKSLLQPIREIKASGKHQLIVTVETANADLPYLFAGTQLQILPAGGPTDEGIGTGPYIIEKFEPGIRTLARRNENYWKEGRAHVDSVELLGLNDLAARVQALETGEVHFIHRVDPKIAGLIGRNPDLELIAVESAGHYTFPMQVDTSPFDQSDVRLALKYAIDRDDIVSKVLGGYGTVGNDHPVPSFDPFFAEDIPQRPYDPDLAKFHFARSGASGPVSLYVADAAFPGAVDAATLYQAHAAMAEIPIDIQRVPNDGYWSEVWMKRPFCAAYWGGRPTADLMLSSVYLSTANWNDTAWKRADFDQLLIKARGELDNAKRKQMYHDLQMMIYEDGGQIVMAFNNWLFAGQRTLGGFVRSPVQTGMRSCEQLYFNS